MSVAAAHALANTLDATGDATVDLNRLDLNETDRPEFDATVPESVRHQLIGDLEFLGSRNGETSSDTFYEIFDSGTFDGSRLTEFFNRRVRKVSMDPDPKDPSLVAYVKTSGDPSVIWLKPSYLTFDIPKIFRVSVLLHEARHTEIDDGFWLHEHCPIPFLDHQGRDVVGPFSREKIEGQSACDHSSYGGYGAQVTFLKHIEKVCSNCNEKLKLDARLYADETLVRVLDPEMQKSLRDEIP